MLLEQLDALLLKPLPESADELALLLQLLHCERVVCGHECLVSLLEAVHVKEVGLALVRVHLLVVVLIHERS